MKTLIVNDFVNDFFFKKDKYSFFIFYFFKNGAKSKEECLQLNLTKIIFNKYPKTINLIIFWYLKKDVDEVEVCYIEKEIQNQLLKETKKKSHI